MPEKENIVKSRFHYGSNSLDITIPSEVVKTMKVNPGDVFRLLVKEEKGNLVLQYERVYCTKV
ncbi:MAG: AbrB/MazE/SpoVT family DNA-binding domain-containing protein [Methanoregula sp.]|jgi:antitoxin component of MazEF toxin-antitoxin module